MTDKAPPGSIGKCPLPENDDALPPTTPYPAPRNFGLTDTQRIDRLVIAVTGLTFMVATMFFMMVLP